MKRRRLLVLTTRFPYPVIGGDRLRIYHLCKALSTEYVLTLLTLCESRAELTRVPDDALFAKIHRIYHPKWRSLIHTAAAVLTKTPLQLAYYRSRAFASACGELATEHDAVLAHLIRAGQYLDELKAIPQVLEMTDAVSLNYARIKSLGGTNGLRKAIFSFEQNRLYQYEVKAARRFNQVWLTSETDGEFLGCLADPRVHILPNGVDTNSFRFKPREGNTLIFIGNMVSLQNQDACDFFVREIFPRVLKHIPIRFRIVGNAPNRVIRRFRSIPSVEVTGRVDHVENGLHDGFAAICPVRVGAGIQNKVLEYLALGLPCVTSSIGLEGIAATPGKHLMKYESPDEAAEQIISLHQNQNLRADLARNGRALVEEEYQWPLVYRQIGELMADLAKN